MTKAMYNLLVIYISLGLNTFFISFRCHRHKFFISQDFFTARALFSLTPLPDDPYLAFSKLKAFADDKFNVTQSMKCFLS